MTAALLTLAVLFPLALFALAALVPSLRPRLAGLLWLAPLPALPAALLGVGARAALPAPLPLSLALDLPGAMLLGGAGLIWVAAGLAAQGWWGEKLKTLPYQAWWLLTLTGSLSVFMAADLVTFYLAFSLVSLAGYGLVTRDGTRTALRAGRIYFALAVLGEAFLLVAFVLLALGSPGIGIAESVAALPASPWRDAALLFILLGFGTKIGLVPLHVWMPPSYGAAPFPAAAVLSGAAVKAGVIGLVRFLPFTAALPGAGDWLAVAGFSSAFLGVALGLTQRNPKTVLAYSSISQMGVIAAVAGMSLAAGRGAAPAELAFYGLHHIFAKGGLFLALAAIALTGERRLKPILWPAAIVALGIAGLPFTGGALAKLAVKDALGNGLAGMLGSLSAAASTLLMLHFLAMARKTAAADANASAPFSITLAWWGAALASLVLPWALFGEVDGSLAKASSPVALFDLAWPMIVGAVAFAVWSRSRHQPLLPAGDILVVLRRIGPLAERASDGLATVEAGLTRWPVAGAALVLIALLLGAAMAIAR